MNPTNRTIAVLTAIFLSFTLMGFECDVEAKSKIGGTVFIDGRPQAYGTVQAWQDGELVAQTRCNQTGHYTLPNLDAGTYTLVYLNARGAPIGGETIVEARMGRFEPVDIELNVQTEDIPD